MCWCRPAAEATAAAAVANQHLGVLVAVSLAVDVVTFGYRVLLVIVIVVVVVRSLVRIRPRLRSCVRVIRYRYPRCCCSFARRSSVLVLAYVPACARSLDARSANLAAAPTIFVRSPLPASLSATVDSPTPSSVCTCIVGNLS